MKFEINNQQSEIYTTRFLWLFLFSIFYFLFFVEQASAAQIYVNDTTEEVLVGETVEVTVRLDSHGQRVNAYAATVQFPDDLLSVEQILDSGSIITHWIDRPAEDGQGVSFSGITPGGYTGSDGLFFSVVFSATAPGTVTFSTTNDQVLLHNGLGTPAQITITHAPATFIISPQSSLFDFLPLSPIVEEVIDLLNETIGNVSETVGGALRNTVEQLPPEAQEFVARAGNFFETLQSYLSSFAGVVGQLFKRIQQFLDDPVIEEIAERYVAPTAIGVSVVFVTPSMSNIFVPLLRYLFLQPLLLLGRKRRREWGQVYNSLTKLPVHLAIVRLVDAATGRVMQSRVTDAQGRYFFIVSPGSYRIEVDKKGLSFPSILLRGLSADKDLTDLYFGAAMSITDDGAAVAANIPLDPEGVVKPPARIIMQHRIRFVQQAVSLTGIFVTAGTFIISPVWYMAAFLSGHICLYLLLLRYVMPKKPKNWGTVSDAKDHRPIDKAIVRLFAGEYNKLVDSQVTGSSGRYAFLVGPNRYYLTVEKSGYREHQTATTEVAEGEVSGTFLAKNIALEKDLDSEGVARI